MRAFSKQDEYNCQKACVQTQRSVGTLGGMNVITKKGGKTRRHACKHQEGQEYQPRVEAQGRSNYSGV